MLSMRRHGLTAALLVGLTLPFASAQAQNHTEFKVAPQFQAYYEAHEGIRVLGNPVFGLQTEDGYYAQYFEKGRIEDHRGEVDDPAWQFMYGRSVAELIEAGVDLPIGGDSSGITYASLGELMAPEQLQPAPKPGVDGVIEEDGADKVFIPYNPQLKAGPGHYVPQYFWDYMNQEELFPGGWLHDFGLPLTEVVTVTVTKADVTREISIQAFERAILTYDPQNPAAWQVERDNVGADHLETLEPGRFDEAILAAVYAAYEDPTTYVADIQLVEGDYARVRLYPQDAATDPSWLFLKRGGQGWELLGSGTAFDEAFYDEHGVPAVIRVDSELERSLYEVVQPYVQEHAGEEMQFHLELERFAGGIAKVRAVPENTVTDTAFIYARLDDVNRWTPLSIGTEFTRDFYEENRIPWVLRLSPGAE